MADGNAPERGAAGQPVKFKGTGHWHAEARKANEQEDNVFIQLHDAARMLQDRHEDQAAQLVLQAFNCLRDSQFEEAGEALRAAARSADARNPAYAQGLRLMAEKLPEDNSPAQPSRPRRGGEDTGSLPALDSE